MALFQAGGDLAHLEWARELWTIIRREFWDEEAGVFYSTGGNAERLLTRQAQAFDAAVLSDNGAGALLAVWMHRYFGDDADEAVARRVVERYHADLLAATGGFGGCGRRRPSCSRRISKLPSSALPPNAPHWNGSWQPTRSPTRRWPLRRRAETSPCCKTVRAAAWPTCAVTVPVGCPHATRRSSGGNWKG